MRKLLMSVIVAVMAFSFSYTAQAEEAGAYDSWMYRIYISGKGQALVPFENSLDVAGYFGGSVGYWWNEYIATELEVGFANVESENNAYNVDVVPLLATVRGDLPFEFGWPMHPYLYGGLGILFNSAEGSGVDVDNSLAGIVGIGVDYEFSDNFLAFIDLRFLFSRPDVNSGAGVVGDDTLDLNSIMLGGGITLKF
ncbi:MAG: outer membrane beta-barrel protein [Chlamydiota bacterium]|nr:outer membrane beta-barrel protein [Chlamydiota bacterium]